MHELRVGQNALGGRPEFVGCDVEEVPLHFRLRRDLHVRTGEFLGPLPQLVVGQHRELIFDAVEELEVAAGEEAVGLRADAAAR